MTDDFDWHVNRKAALAEQFPSITKLRDERPGCTTDRERQQFYREATELKRARWAEITRERMLTESLEEARRRRQQQANEYRAYQARKHTKTPAQSGVSLLEAS